MGPDSKKTQLARSIAAALAELPEQLVNQAACDARRDETPTQLFDLELDAQRYVLLRVAANPPRLLTQRQEEVARMVADGLTNKQVARSLNIAPRTVASHLRAIFARLHVGSRVALVRKLGPPARRMPSLPEARAGQSPAPPAF